MKYDIVKLMARRKIRWKKRWVSGDSGGRLTFRSKKAGRLSDYRIYGNTVDGESVGDRTGNLFDMSSVYAIGYIDDSGNIVVAQGYVITTYDFIPIDQSSSYSIKICGKLNINTNQRKIRVAFYDRDQIFISRIGLGEASDVRTFNAINNSHYIRISIDDGNTNIMLNEGSTALPYEPYGYRVPVMVNDIITNLYLPEQIKKVGDEAEYIDYGEQKQHRVRKNLLQNTATSQTINGVTFTVNSDGSVTCNGTASAITYFNLNENFNSALYAGMKASFYQSGQQPTVNTIVIRISKANRVSIQDFTMNDQVIIDNGDSLLLAIRINFGYTCDNLTFYPMIRKADVEDDTYEPYIEDTDLDVTLPALPILTGTNVLSVGTAVQPSRVEVKGRIKAVAGDGAGAGDSGAGAGSSGAGAGDSGSGAGGSGAGAGDSGSGAGGSGAGAGRAGS